MLFKTSCHQCERNYQIVERILMNSLIPLCRLYFHHFLISITLPPSDSPFIHSTFQLVIREHDSPNFKLFLDPMLFRWMTKRANKLLILSHTLLLSDIEYERQCWCCWVSEWIIYNATSWRSFEKPKIYQSARKNNKQ